MSDSGLLKIPLKNRPKSSFSETIPRRRLSSRRRDRITLEMKAGGQVAGPVAGLCRSFDHVPCRKGEQRTRRAATMIGQAGGTGVPARPVAGAFISSRNLETRCHLGPAIVGIGPLG